MLGAKLVYTEATVFAAQQSSKSIFVQNVVIAVLGNMVLQHLEAVGMYRQPTLTAFCDDVLAQDCEPRIPVLAFVDAKHAAGKTEGYRYAGMPPDRETWRLVARGLDEAAGGGAGVFAEIDADARGKIVDAFASGELEGGAWAELDVSRAWSVVTRDCLSVFYAHPWAWNEIGFGGPAYPRGYARLGVGVSEAWEGEEAIDPDPVEDVKRKGFE